MRPSSFPLSFFPFSFPGTNFISTTRGDSSVGIHNYGVNGGMNHSSPLHSVGLAVELGSGSLDKTRLLLRSMSKLLQPQEEGGEQGVMKKIDYRAVRCPFLPSPL